jgi:hypothetical protein
LGERFQIIADVEAPAEEADELAAATVAWLVAGGIVAAELTDCGLSAPAHPPGPHYTKAVTPGPYRGAGGVEVVTGRTVFYSTDMEQVTCPHCGRATSLADRDGQLNEAWQELSDTIGVWFGSGRGELPCRSCGRRVGLNDWTWSPPWGFGYLGFTFWNWPRLSPPFLAGMSRRLGHRTVHPYGKI